MDKNFRKFDHRVELKSCGDYVSAAFLSEVITWHIDDLDHPYYSVKSTGDYRNNEYPIRIDVDQR